MFSRSTGETEDLLGARSERELERPRRFATRRAVGACGSSITAIPRRARPGRSTAFPRPPRPPTRRYRGGVSFDETLVDIMDSSSSDGEYSYVDPGSPRSSGFSNNARARRGTPAPSALARGRVRGARAEPARWASSEPSLSSPRARCSSSSASSPPAVDRDIIPAGITDYFQRVQRNPLSAARARTPTFALARSRGYIPRHRAASSPQSRARRMDEAIDPMTGTTPMKPPWRPWACEAR